MCHINIRIKALSASSRVHEITHDNETVTQSIYELLLKRPTWYIVWLLIGSIIVCLLCIEMGFTCCTVPWSPLIVWAYLRLVVSITYAALAYYVTWLLMQQNDPRLIPVTLTLVALTLVNWTFSNILIVGLHNKSYMMLLVFLIYSVLEVVVTAAWQLWQVVDVMPLLLKDSKSFYNYWKYWNLKIIIPFVFNMLLPTYFIIAIRRVLLIIKGQNSREVGECVKKTEGPNVRLSPVVVEQDRRDIFICASAPPEEIALYPMGDLQSLSTDNNEQNK